MTESAVVMFSGGLDSTVALWWTLDRGWRPLPLSIQYDGRPRGEREAARRLAASAGLRLLEVPLPFYQDLQAWRSCRPLPPDLAGASPVYLPAKNLLFYAIAAYYAEVLGAVYIVGGHYRQDGVHFPDASADYFGRLTRLITDGLWSRRPRLEMPFLQMTKADIVRLGLALGAPLEQTWSCYRDGAAPCGQCRGCREKTAALRTAGIGRPERRKRPAET